MLGDVQSTITQKRPSAHEHYVLRTNICLAIEIQKDLEFDAKDASSLLFTSYGEEKKRVH